MNGRNSIIVVVFLLLIGIIVFYMMFKVRDVDNGIREMRTEEHTAELADALNEFDYQIYLIGELPQYMEGISDHVIQLTAGQANSANLPVSEGTVGFTSYDEDGNVLMHIEQRDYAPYMMIIINTQDELSETALAAVQDSAVNNHVPVLLVGRNNIDLFREYMILVHKDYDQNATMFFEISRYPVDNPINPDIVSNGGHEYADAMLAFIRDVFVNPAVVYAQDMELPTETSETEETIQTEETADAA